MNSESRPEPSPRAPALGLEYLAPLFTSPGAAFRALSARPGRAWPGPVVVSAVLVTLAAWVMLPQLLEVSYESAAAMMEKFGTPQEEMDEALEAMPLEPNGRVLATQVFPSLLTTPVLMLVGALVVFVGMRIMGARGPYALTFSMFSLAYVIWALGMLVRAGAVAAAGTIEVTFGPGALLPGVEYFSPLGIFLDLFDVFSIWHLFVLVTGISVVGGVSRGTAWGVGLAYWVLRSVFLAGSKVFMMWTQSG
ncbi:MAG TPA: YIP1 family protein [bacterium]|nr:YIP1 family protein [bacterium]